MSKPKPTKTESPLALASPATVQPKPRKEDIINALVERARVKHEVEAKEIEKQREKLEMDLREAVKAHFRANPSLWVENVTSWSGRLRTLIIEVRCADVPAKIKQLQNKFNQLPSLTAFNAVEVKRRIREAMSQGKGASVKALLGNAEMVKKLDQTLKAIGA